MNARIQSERGLGITRRAILLSAALVLAIAGAARAGDLDSAKQQLEKVKVDVDNASWTAIDDDVKATEQFLDGLPDADRAPVQKELDDLKAKAAPGIKDYKSKTVLDSSKRELDEVADSLATSPAGAKDMLDRVTQRLNSDDAKKYADPDQVEKLKNRVASLQAMVVTKYVESAAPIVKELDDAMAAQPFKDAKSDEEVTHAQQSLDSLKSRINGALSDVPANDPRVVAIQQKIAAYDKVIAAAVGSAGATQAGENLAHQWEAQKEYFAGWDQEKDCPSWDQWSKTSSESVGNMDLTKTLELVTRVGQWLNEDGIKSTATQYADNATVKATMAEAHQAYDAAALKLNTNFNKLVGEAEQVAAPADSDRRGIDHLASRADYFFHGTTYLNANVARSKALLDKWNGAVAGASAAKDAALVKMTADANAAWPAIAAKIKATEGFTPDKLSDFTGKIIHLKGNNRLGYDFQPGEYSYARSINGMAVAGKFDPAVKAAVDAARNAIPPDQFTDEDWDVYAVVEGPGKIQGRTNVEGDVKVDGEKVGTVTSEQHPTVDCAVIKIFALHAGPVAVGSDGQGGAAVGAPAGVVATSGTAAATEGAGFSVVALLGHLIELAICVGAAGLVVLKVKPALVVPAGAEVAAKLPGNEQVELIGLGIAAIGALWLVGKLVLGDLLPAGFLTLCGVLLAGDWLANKKILPIGLAGTIKSLAIPIAGGTVLFGVLHLFLAHWYLF